MGAAHLKGPPINFEHRSGCTGKFAYDTAKIAHDKARKRKVHYYHCKYCGLWHLTSSKKRPPRLVWTSPPLME